jgi:hypothetical protein
MKPLSQLCISYFRDAIRENGMSLRCLDILPLSVREEILDTIKKPDLCDWKTRMYYVQAELILDTAEEYWVEWIKFYKDEYAQLIYIRLKDSDQVICIDEDINDNKWHAYLDALLKKN